MGALAAQAAAAAAASKAGGSGAARASGAAAAGGSGSSVGGVLFDWLLPVLQRRATPSGRPLAAHQQVAVLAALRDCLAGELSSPAPVKLLLSPPSPRASLCACRPPTATCGALVAAAGVDATTLARYANAVLAACQALLEDEAAPPAALPPLLAVLHAAARHQHSLK